ncbi:MAG: glycosyltransferase [Blastocatellia bacterium]|nr:glycosyltransferase [Blastocatellia bacterium]
MTVVLPFGYEYGDGAAAQITRQIESITSHPEVNRILILHRNLRDRLLIAASSEILRKVRFIEIDTWLSGRAMQKILDACDSDALLLMLDSHEIAFEPRSLEQFLAAIEHADAGLVYSDFRQVRGSEAMEYPTIDYQLGSLRDSFDFGHLVVISKGAAEQALKKYGPIDPAFKWGGLYDLRLKISTDLPILRIPEALYVKKAAAIRSAQAGQETGDQKICQVDTTDSYYQIEAEHILTAHLKRIGAYLEENFSPLPPPVLDCPVTASVIIPVYNREATIVGAIESALNQITSFSYNIIVVDDSSTDRTTQLIRQIADKHRKVIHKTPRRRDLGIGGLWNEAIYSPECGLYAVQLDSDDVYSHSRALETMVGAFRKPTGNSGAAACDTPRYAMVVGSYTYVDFNLKEIPQGLAQHRELSLENGRNNILRLDGPGAPRAYYLPVLRRIGFPNVSYGEDYAVILRISREYQIGRVFDSVCLVRQWEGNTSRSLPLGNIKSTSLKEIVPASLGNQQEFILRMRPILMPLIAATRNRYNAYKDYLRTVEIQARMNRH